MRKRILVSICILAIMVLFTQFKMRLISTATAEDPEVSTIINKASQEVDHIVNPDMALDQETPLNEAEVAGDTTVSEDLDDHQNPGQDPNVATGSDELDKAPGASITTVSSVTESQDYKASPSTSADSDQAVITYEALKTEYTVRMEALEAIAESTLNDLIDNAKADYLLADPIERDKLDFKSVLATKYYALAKNLEEMLDQAVIQTLSQLKTELEDQNLETHLVEDLNKTYEDEKRLRREEIMSEIMSKIWND